MAEEGLAGRSQLGEPVVDHLLRTIDIDGPDLVVLVDALLGHSLVVMPLLRSQVAEVDVHLGEGGRLLVHLLVCCRSLREDSEAPVHAVADGLGDVA